jgi:hypothetical protein
MPIAGQRVRVPGSGFTVFHWNAEGTEHIIAFAQQVTVNSVPPVADAVAIQPLNAQHPVEIVTPGAHTNGVLTLQLTELYGQSVWQRLAGLSNSQDIVDIMRTVAGLNRGIQISRIIKPPPGVADRIQVETYYNCVITAVEDSETIDITQMRVDKNVTVWYTNSIKNWINGGRRKFALT